MISYRYQGIINLYLHNITLRKYRFYLFEKVYILQTLRNAKVENLNADNKYKFENKNMAQKLSWYELEV